MNYISLGGWCGTKIALKDLGLFNEQSLPFDSVRSSIEGVIDCIENDFQNFFPSEIKKDDRFPNWIGFVGEYVGFYHHNHNVFDPNVIESFTRKFIRFDEKIKKNNCIFLRTIIRDNYDDEIKYYKKLQKVIDKKYPNISYIICFMIPNQDITQYYKKLDERTFLFALNDKTDNSNLKNAYRPIFKCIINKILRNNIPNDNDMTIINTPSRLWIVDGYPVVNYIEK
jgi:hypothetical protein